MKHMSDAHSSLERHCSPLSSIGPAVVLPPNDELNPVVKPSVVLLKPVVKPPVVVVVSRRS